MNIALVFAGGSGTRMGASEPKQFIEIHGKPVLAHTLAIFQEHAQIDGIWLVVAADCMERAKDLASRYGISKLRGLSCGGDSAQASIYNGLVAMSRVFEPETIVLIHDGVRPYVEPYVLSDNIAAVAKYGNAVTFTPCYETIVLSKNGQTIDALPYRRESYTAQAPQSFRLGDILAAHERIRARPSGYSDMIDQATIYWTLRLPIHLVPGNRGNIKITTPEDLCMLAALLDYQEDRKNGNAGVGG